MKEGLLGFFAALALGLGVFAAMWRWLDRMERRVLVQHHAR